MKMLKDNTISSRGAKEILAIMFQNGGDPESIAHEHNFIQQSDTGTLEAVATKIIEAYPQVAAEYKAGKSAALQFLIGQGMKETKGSGNPAVLREVFSKLLS